MSEHRHGPFIPPEPEKGDPNTIGGYAAVHNRPAAFEGVDGDSYSVDIVVDRTADREQPYAGYFLFIRWRQGGEPRVEGHLESDYIMTGATAEAVRAQLGATRLNDVKRVLDALIRDSRLSGGERPWWDVMRDEEGN